MFTFSSVNLRRVAIALLMTTALFFGSVLSMGSGALVFAAEPLERDAVDLPRQEVSSEAEIEAAQAKRRKMQAEASERAKKDDSSESAAEKLNLDELAPQKNNKFTEQVGR